MYKKNKQCFFEEHNIKHIDYKDVSILKKFLDAYGRIIPRRVTGLTANNQRKLENAIKRARYMALIGYTEN